MPMIPAETVKAINAAQWCDRMHPLTCGGAGCREVLVADSDGLLCPKCGYRQTWVPPGFLGLFELVKDQRYPWDDPEKAGSR